MSKRFPAGVRVLFGALCAVVVLGYAGYLSSITPTDRLLNPDARNYWESEEAYFGKIVDHCAEFVEAGRGEEAADACLKQSLEEAFDRGYLPRFDTDFGSDGDGPD